MTSEESQLHYQNAKERLELLQVLVGVEDIVSTWNKAAEEMQLAGDYQDARELAVKYKEEAKRAEIEGKEKIYRRSLERMENYPGKAVMCKLAKEELLKIQGYKDVEERLEECSRLIREAEARERRRKNRKLVALIVIVALVLTGVVRYENMIYEKNQAAMETEITDTSKS